MIACMYAPINGLVPDIWRFINLSNNINKLCAMHYALCGTTAKRNNLNNCTYHALCKAQRRRDK